MGLQFWEIECEYGEFLFSMNSLYDILAKIISSKQKM